jgi:hypothetical protein
VALVGLLTAGLVVRASSFSALDLSSALLVGLFTAALEVGASSDILAVGA